MTTYPAKKLKRTEKPKPCVECQIELAIPPYTRCLNCLDHLSEQAKKFERDQIFLKI